MYISPKYSYLSNKNTDYYMYGSKIETIPCFKYYKLHISPLYGIFQTFGSPRHDLPY